jgi:DivIVA domain-containing protein
MTGPDTAPGERFRRRALKRGYKVDEVEEFLERVEETLTGRARGNSGVTAEDVREVVFRVRFGGYDEWQVDKHLDRLERQLEDLAQLGRGGPLVEDRPTQVVPAIRDDVDRQRGGARGPVPSASAGTTYGGPPVGAGTTVPNGRGAARDVHAGTPSFDDVDTSWAGRHGKTDMTMEMPQYGPGSPYTPEDATRIGQLRSTFKPRRFGSGYDPREVDRLFDGIAAVVTGRSGGSIDTKDLDGSQFELIQGGYFEDEVDVALREVREIITRARS